MRLDGIGEVEAAIQVLVRLEIQIIVPFPQFWVVVRLGEEPGGTKHNGRQALGPIEEFTELLRSRLGHPVDVLRNGLHVFSDPGGGLALGWAQRRTESTRRAGEDNSGNAARKRGLENAQCAQDVCLCESMARVRCDMRLVQRSGMYDQIDPAHAVADEVRIADRSDPGRKRRVQEVETCDLVLALPQGPHESLPEMAGASSHEKPHRLQTPVEMS